MSDANLPLVERKAGPLLFGAGGRVCALARRTPPAPPAAWMPRADIRETEKEYILDLPLPGVKKGDVNIEVTDDVLTVSGDKGSGRQDKAGTWLRRETSFGTFQRCFFIPQGLRAEHVKAFFKDGILTLTMTKPA